MAMNYSQWLTAITTILNITDSYGLATFNALVDRIIEYAELMMYRDPDLDFLATRTEDSSKTTMTGVRSVAIPSQFVIVDSVALITPANSIPSDGTRIPLLRTTREFCDVIWPQESLTKSPATYETYWATFSMFEAVGSGATSSEPVAMPSAIIIAPTPDNQYRVEFAGTFRPPALSAANSTTFLTTWLPDLFLAATVIMGAGYQRDYGADGNQADPSLAGYWQREYDKLKAGAAIESARQASRSAGWSSKVPAPLANVSRTQNPPPPAPRQ